MPKVTSNISKIKELTDKISSEFPDDGYKGIVKKLKGIVEKGKLEIENSETPQSQIKCYEKMCSTITNILKEVNPI